MHTLIVDDHQLIRSGLRDLIVNTYNDVTICEADNGPEALKLIQKDHFDLAIVDLFMPGESVFVFLRKLCNKQPELPVLVLSASVNSAHARKCIDLGACAYVPKSAPQKELLAAIETTLSGGIYIAESLSGSNTNSLFFDGLPDISVDTVTSRLTTRQQEIFRMLASGKSNKLIARECSLSDNTVKVHVSAILKALELKNRTQLGLLAQKLEFSETGFDQ